MELIHQNDYYSEQDKLIVRKIGIFLSISSLPGDRVSSCWIMPLYVRAYLVLARRKNKHKLAPKHWL